jgi:hypothetical protein
MICGVSRPTSRATHHPSDFQSDTVAWGWATISSIRRHRTVDVKTDITIASPIPRHVAAEGTKGLSRRLLTKEMPMSKREKTYHEDLGQPADPSNSFEKKQNERPVELSSERLGEDDNDPGALPIGTPGSSNATK